MNPLSSISRKIPFLKYTVTFCLGILFGLNPEHWSSWIWLVAFLSFLAVLLVQKFISNNRPKNTIQAVLVVFSLFVLAWVYSSNYTKHRFDPDFIDHASYTGYIFEKSPLKKNRFSYQVHITSFRDSAGLQPSNEKVLLYVSDSSLNKKLELGSQLVFKAKFYPISSANNPGEFNYQQFMYWEGIRYQAYVNKDIRTFSSKKRTLKILALQAQSKLQEKYLNAGIGGDEFAVLAALTLGNKSYLTPELKSRFANSGAMHVLAVSGLHVGIIYLILLFLFKPVANSKKLKPFKITLIILLLWAYAFITGLSPSVLRSATMFSLILIGQNLNRKTNIYNTLAFSAFLLMLIDPTILYKAGFQLSYAAVTSIVFFQPKIASLLKTEHRMLKGIRDLLAVSIAAQIGTFPLSIYYFHQFPVYFWLSNFVVIPAATLLLYLSFLFFLCSPIRAVSHLIGILLNYSVKGLNWSVEFIEKLPGAVIHNLWMDRILMLLLILFLLLAAWAVRSKRSKSILAVLGLFMVILCYTTFVTIQKYRQATLVFYNTYTQPMLSLIDGKRQYYYSVKDTLDNHSQQLINNCSNYFGIQQTPVNLRECKNEPNIRLFENRIFYKNLTISCTNKEQTLPLPNGTIVWQASSGIIFVNKSSNLRFYTLKKDEIINITIDKNPLQYKTQNNSPLLIKIRIN